jgi:hypothetical protein
MNNMFSVLICCVLNLYYLLGVLLFPVLPIPIPSFSHTVNFHVLSAFYIPYSRRLAKIKKIHMSPKGFEPMTSKANASGSYHYTTYMFMPTSITENTSTTFLPKPTYYPCTMRSSR